MGSQWNPVIIDFGKARFITDPKPVMSLTASSSSQESYKRRYPDIAPEIVAGVVGSPFHLTFFTKNSSRNFKLAANGYCDVVENF